MPSLLCPSAQRLHDFMSHSHAFVAQLPTGYDLYFTLPFDLASLHFMRPTELMALDYFLQEIKDEVAVQLGHSTLENVIHVQKIILRWLEEASCLGDLETQAWTAGFGFPVYDEFHCLVGFYWDWDAIELEGGVELVPAYCNMVHPISTGHDSHPMNRTPLRYTTPPRNTPANRSRYGSANRDRMHSESGKPVITYGATFANINECFEYLDSVTDHDLALIKDQFIQLEGDSHCGIRRIRGPNADLHSERDSQASWIDVETIEPIRIQNPNRHTKNEAKTYSPRPIHAWEDFYQRGLISYGMAAETNTLVPYTDLYLLKLYKAMRDTGLSERDSMQTVMDVKRRDPLRRVPKRPVWDDYSRRGEEKSTYTFSDEPDYGTSQETIQQVTPRSKYGDPIEEHHTVLGRRMERAKNSGQDSERRFRIVQPTSSLETRQPSFTNQPEPQHSHYVQTPSTYYQSRLVDGRNSLRCPGHENEHMTQNKATKSLSESKRKEPNWAHSKPETRKVLKNALAAHKSKTINNRPLQNTPQQATPFQNHKQQVSSASSVQDAIKKREHAPETVHQKAFGPRRTINSLDANAHRARSFQEPTRFFKHPRATARPSSYHEGLHDSDWPKPPKSSYQAYAEDSPEDSPRAAPGSWRDV